MNSNIPRSDRRRAEAAHSLPEAIIAVLVIGLMLVSLYAGFSSGFSIVQSSREELRATQILQQRLETIRLYTWSQLLDTNNYVSPTFVEYLTPAGQTNPAGGTIYSGIISLRPPPELPKAYRHQVREVTVKVYWTNQSGGLEMVRSRQMQTHVARYGLQNYLVGK
jgi:hypothetical protein